MSFYPVKFEPILKETLWGGNKLKKFYNKQTDLPLVGESWEISGVNGNVSIISNGHFKGLKLTELLKRNPVEVLGRKVADRFGNEFPLLIKFIDARENLSVQVHPNDELADKRHKNSFGKTEMWYILQTLPGAKLVLGFDKVLDREKYIKKSQNGTIEDVLNYKEIAPGEAFLIPAGLVHAIGAGIVLIEVQQTSDITYRIYDYKRKDKNGSFRKLHISESIEAIDFSAKALEPPETKTSCGIKYIAECKYFSAELLDLNLIDENTELFKEIDSFVILVCFDGTADLKYKGGLERINKGESILVPAILVNNISLSGNAKLLKVYIR